MTVTSPPDVAPAVRLVADRLADPQRVAAVAGRADNREPVYGTVRFSPLTLATGLTGVALLHAELARRDDAALVAAHRQVEAAGRHVAGAASGGLHAGPASLLAAAQTCAAAAGDRGRRVYPGLRAQLARWLAEEQLARLAACAAQRRRGVPWRAYDVVNGVAGTTRLLLDVVADPVEDGPHARRALQDGLMFLVRLADPLPVAGHQVPGWWVPPDLQVGDLDRAASPSGDFNLGMAHGIPGPLAVLATALLHGQEVPGQREAVHRIAQWLVERARRDEAGLLWPCRLSLEEELEAQQAQQPGDPREPEEPGEPGEPGDPAGGLRRPAGPARVLTRSAWCYGAPGVAVALLLAARAVGVPGWRQAATAALRHVLERPVPAWNLDGATVCHGFAGLLQALHRAVELTGDPVLAAGRHRVAALLLDHVDEDAPFAVRHRMRVPGDHGSPPGFVALDVPGVLEGAAGVACALLPLLPGAAPPSRDRAWDRCLALS